MKPKTMIVLLAMSAAHAGCANKPADKPQPPIAPSTTNPYEKGSKEWFNYETNHIFEMAAQDLDARSPKAGREFRQDVRVTQLEVGMTYDWSQVGMADRVLQRADASGSSTTYVHVVGNGQYYITVDDRTMVITHIRKHHGK